MSDGTTVQNYIGGQWLSSAATEYLDVRNPANGERMAQVPLSPAAELDQAAQAAAAAFPGWRRTPAVEFFMQKKVVVERWPKEWSRRF